MTIIDKTDDWESRQDIGRQQPSSTLPQDPYGLAAQSIAEAVAETQAPNPIDVARQRTSDFVRNISNNTKLDLQRRVDELINTITRITKSETALIHFIGEFAKLNHEAVDLSAEVAKLIDDIATPFKLDPPATITQPSKDQGS
jgi:hypothetical protein